MSESHIFHHISFHQISTQIYIVYKNGLTACSGNVKAVTKVIGLFATGATNVFRSTSGTRWRLHELIDTERWS